jgi:hypothetical protein
LRGRSGGKIRLKTHPFIGLAVKSVENIYKALFIFSTIKFV